MAMAMARPMQKLKWSGSNMLATAASVHHGISGRFSVVRAMLFGVVGGLLVIVSFFEAISQLPNGRASPVQLPLLTTRTTMQLSRGMREELVRGDVKSAQLSRLARIAAMRLADEPLDATALWLWSFSQNPRMHKRALDLAQRLSLRETAVQLQLMKIEAMAGDLPASLTHLDNALLVSDAAAPTILQALAKGLDQPNLVKLLKPYGSRSWYKMLVEQAVLHAPDPANASDLLLQTKLSSQDLSPQLITSLVTRLVMGNNYNAAKIIVRRFVGLQDSSFMNFAVAAETMVPEAAPLSWTFSADTNLAAQPIGDGVLFDFERGFGGSLMTRITGFRAGNYTLRQAIDASTSDLTIRWELQCLEGGKFKKIWSQIIPAGTREQIYDINISVQPTCPVQRWELLSLNESVDSRATLTVKGLRLLKQ